MYTRVILILGFSLLGYSLLAQNFDKQFALLQDSDIQFDSLDQERLKDNSLFLMDMSSLAETDTTAMNRAIIQMSTKLLSNNLTEITDEEARVKKDQITKIIHGAFEHHGLSEEKKLSAMSWYNMIVKEIKI